MYTMSDEDYNKLLKLVTDQGTKLDRFSAGFDELVDSHQLLKAMYEAEQTRADLLQAQLDEEKQRTQLFSDSMRRGLELWKKQHPDAHHFPDGADNFLWLLNEVESVHSQLRDAEAVLLKYSELDSKLYDKYYSRHNLVEVK